MFWLCLVLSEQTRPPEHKVRRHISFASNVVAVRLDKSRIGMKILCFEQVKALDADISLIRCSPCKGSAGFSDFKGKIGAGGVANIVPIAFCATDVACRFDIGCIWFSHQ